MILAQNRGDSLPMGRDTGSLNNPYVDAATGNETLGAEIVAQIKQLDSKDQNDMGDEMSKVETDAGEEMDRNS